MLSQRANDLPRLNRATVKLVKSASDAQFPIMAVPASPETWADPGAIHATGMEDRTGVVDMRTEDVRLLRVTF